MKIYIRSSVYRYNGSVADKFGNIRIRDVEFTTAANSVEEAKRNILYQAKRRLGLRSTASLKLCSPNAIREVEVEPIKQIRHCPHCGTQLSDGGYCPKCYAYGNEINYSD